jgi:uncharacterized protein
VNERKGKAASVLPLVILGILLMFALPAAAEQPIAKPLVYDRAELLSDEEENELRSLAAELGAERETDFLIITLDGTGGLDIEDYVARFYDDIAPGYDRPHGNAAILAIDLRERDVFLAGFGKAETYLDSGRLDKIRGKITPLLSASEYYEAFEKYILLAHDYMGYRPGVNPDNILFRDWFQVAVALVVGAVTVGVMAANAGGRVTVNDRTYLDEKRSGVVAKRDQFIHKTVTKTKIEKPSSGGGSFGGGGGGGVTPGGRSFSSSRGKF